MSYYVFCTFDLKDASSDDYEGAYADLEQIGLTKVMAANDKSKVVIPTTSVAGEFDGDSATNVRDAIRERVKKAFAARGFSSEIFVVVGGNWAWGATTT